MTDVFRWCLAGLRHRRHRKGIVGLMYFQDEVVSGVTFLPTPPTLSGVGVAVEKGSGRFFGRDLNADWRKH